MTALLGDPVKTDLERIQVTREELNKYLNKKKLPNTKKNRISARAALRKRKWRQSLPRGRDITFSQSDAPRQIIYGETRFGGVVTFLENQKNDKINLHTVVTVAGHAISSIDRLYLDGNEVNLSVGSTISPSDPRWSISATAPDGTTLAFYNSAAFLAIKTGLNDQTALGDLIGTLPDLWTSAHRQRGCAHTYLLMRWNAQAYANGMPDIEFEGEGKIQIFDPRTSTSGYSKNAALCIADVLVNPLYGMGYTFPDIDTGTGPGGLQWAANICDENVNLKDGGTEKRYEVHGVWDMDMTPEEIIQDMLTAMAGSITFIGGKWRFWPGKYTAPTLTLTESDLRSAVNIEVIISQTDNFNSIKGTFVAAENKYEVTDFPAISLTAEVAKDNGVVTWEDIALPCTTSTSMAQRVAMIMLRKQRETVRVSALFSMKAFLLQPGDTVMLTMSRYGFSSKVFEVEDFEFYQDTQTLELSVELVLKETSAAIYSWDETQDEQKFPTSPNTNLPSPFKVLPPSGLTLSSGTSELFLQGDGSIIARLKVAWTKPDDPFVTEGGRYEIELKVSSTTKWVGVGSVDGATEEFFYAGIKDGILCDVRVRSVSALGVHSTYVTQSSYLILGKSAPPSNVTGLTATIEQFGIRLKWSAVSDLDLRDYEIRYGGAAWDSSTHIENVKALTYLWQVQVAGVYKIWIKARDASMNYSVSAASVNVTITAPESLTPSHTIEGPDAHLAWDVPNSMFTIREYRISYGATFAGSTAILSAATLKAKVRVDWGGLRKFWVVAVDDAGNVGAPASIDINIVAPGVVQDLDIKTIDNNVLIDFDAPATGTMPVEKYLIYKGGIFPTVDFIGSASGTFHTYFETVGGEYTYWVVAVDTAGNEGPESGQARLVYNPPDYLIIADQIIDPEDPNATLINCIPVGDGQGLVGATDPTETWEDHFVNNSATNFEDFINNGYSVYIQPTLGTIFSFEYFYDLGQVLPQQLISVAASITELFGSSTHTITISYKEDVVDPWTDVVASQVFAQNFRYIKILIEVDTLDKYGLVRIDSVRLTINVKKQTDSGLVTITSPGGTFVPFNLQYLEVSSVNVSAQGNTGLYAVRDFTGGSNPTGFYAYLFDNDGSEIGSGSLTWSAEGIVTVV